MEDVSILHSRKDHLKTDWKEPEKLIKRLPETRLKECRPCTHSYQQSHPWTMAIKLLTKSFWVGHTVFEGRSLLCPPLPGKAIKLFFSTSSKTLSLRFDSAPVHRGWVFGFGSDFQNLEGARITRVYWHMLLVKCQFLGHPSEMCLGRSEWSPEICALNKHSWWFCYK